MRARCSIVSVGSACTIADVAPTPIAHILMPLCASPPVRAPPRPVTLAFAYALPDHLDAQWLFLCAEKEVATSRRARKATMVLQQLTR